MISIIFKLSTDLHLDKVKIWIYKLSVKILIGIYFLAMKCFGISIGCILNFSIVHSVYGAVMVFWYFLFRCVSTFVHNTTDMGVAYIDYHSLIVFFGISDWMCHFSIGHSMSIIWLTFQLIAHSVYRSLMFWYF